MAQARDNGTVTPGAVGDITLCTTNQRDGYIALPLLDPRLATAWEAAFTVQCQIQEYRETDRVFYDPGTHDDVRYRVDGAIVNRYSIDAVSARRLVGNFCGTDVLHPNEEYLFSRAIGELCAYGGPQPGRTTLVDIYARNRDGTIRGDETSAETHTVLLYVRSDQSMAMLDPSNDNFSSFVRPLLNGICAEHNVTPITQVVIPGGALFRGSLRGGSVATADRDCVSIALAAANMISRNPNTEEKHIHLLTNTPDVVAGPGVPITRRLREASQREIVNTVAADQYGASFRRNASTDPLERSDGGMGPWIEANIRVIGTTLPEGREMDLAATAAGLRHPPKHTPEQLSLLALLEPGPGNDDRKNMIREIRRVIVARMQTSSGAEGPDTLLDPAHHPHDLHAALAEVRTTYQAHAIGLGVQNFVSHSTLPVQGPIRSRSSSVGDIARNTAPF